MNPFDYVNAVNFTKKDIFQDEKNYNSFIINRSLSYSMDTVFYANEINRSDIPNRMQFDFLLHSIPKKKRFNKWVKKDTLSDNISLIQNHYKYNMEKAMDVLSILSESQIETIKQQIYKGGTQ
jgi:hypothetical protein